MADAVTSAQIDQAVKLLKAGKLVAFPTETVYGLGADASNNIAVQKIFTAKGRPVAHPLIVHLANIQQLKEWASDIPAIAWHLAEHFWPGPLTMIVKRASHVNDLLTGGQDTIGLRIPQHPIAQALLTAFGGGIAAPSANKFGRISPTQAAHVQEELGDRVDLILEGGNCAVGIESTIVDVTEEMPRLLRPGLIGPSQLAKIMQMQTVGIDKNQHNKSKSIIRTSGMLASHYAPLTPLKILIATELLAAIKTLLDENKKFSVLAHTILPIAANQYINWLTMPNDPKEYAHELYAKMRSADNHQGKIILVEAIPHSEPWLAIWDRLQKAAH